MWQSWQSVATNSLSYCLSHLSPRECLSLSQLIGRTVGNTLDRSPVHHSADTRTPYSHTPTDLTACLWMAPGGNPRRHEENMQTPCRKDPGCPLGKIKRRPFFLWNICAVRNVKLKSACLTALLSFYVLVFSVPPSFLQFLPLLSISTWFM